MVYSGKPSRACGTCRNRRIKCDEARPICSQCIKSKRECTGYRDEADLVFRDQTEKTELRLRQEQPDLTPRSLRSEASRRAQSTGAGKKRKASLILDSSNSNLPAPQPVSPASIPLTIPECHEQQALCYFISEYVIIPQHYERSRGYFEFLLPLYLDARSQSPLLASTAATALAVFSKRPGRKKLMSKARTMYGLAVTLTQKAIADAVEVRSDLTLSAVMLLGLFESFTASEETFPTWGHHADGAAAIVKLRGRDMLSSTISSRLFYAVQSQMVMNHVSRCEPVEEVALRTFESWRISPEQDCQSVANRLVMITMEVPALRAAGGRLLQSPMNRVIARKIVLLLREVQRVDRQLVSWSFGIPDSWRYSEMGRSSQLDAPYLAEFHPGSFHVYNDLWIAGHWNVYRAYRILCQSLILNCLERIIPPLEIRETEEYCITAAILQNLVDGICASVPYHIGFPAQMYDTGGNNNLGAYGRVSRDDSDLPERKPDETARCENTRELAGCILRWKLFTAESVIVIPDSQRVWITNRLRYIGGALGIGHGEILADPGPVSLKNTRKPSITDFAPARDLWWEQTGGLHWRQLLNYERALHLETEDLY